MAARLGYVLALFLLLLLHTAAEIQGLKIPRFTSPRLPTQRRNGNSAHRATTGRDLLSKCELRWRNATLDHFSWVDHGLPFTTFRQRYYVCDEYWTKGGRQGPIFFYLGNEADVLLYLNNTGLIWESAPEFKALVVFAEHRYYGLSKPPFPKLRKHMEFLSAEQAMGDYAELIFDLKREYRVPEAAVIGFGGSYGGMLASWFRMKYPHLLDGAIAGSAPIWNFIGEEPAFNPNAFADGVTYDASPAGGSAAACVPKTRKAWRLLQQLGASEAGRKRIKASIGLCEGVVVDSEEDVLELRDWLSDSWDYMAMGNFPYPSPYILNGDGLLPAFPVRVACSHLADDTLEGDALLKGLAGAAGVYYNHSGTLQCLDFRQGVNPESEEDGDFWGYQYCTEMFMPFSKNGVTDMFWPDRWDEEAAAAACKEQWGVEPRRLWATVEWGGQRIQAASNIVFSNGLYDPWHGGGVLRNMSESLLATIIPEGAHHLDLMFSHPKDPASVTATRNFQRSQIAKWIATRPTASAGTASTLSDKPAGAAELQQQRQQQQQQGSQGVEPCRGWIGKRGRSCQQ